MPFGYNSVIFPHPSVQYIPLNPWRRYEEENVPLPTDDMQISILKEPADLKPYSGNLPQLPSHWEEWPEGLFATLCQNGRLEKLLYRSSEIRGVGKYIPGNTQLWLLTGQYFYRESFFVYIFAPDGKLLAQTRFSL